MTNENKLEANIILIAKEIRRLHQNKFTGTSTLIINLKDGGIGRISVNNARNLCKNENNEVF